MASPPQLDPWVTAFLVVGLTGVFIITALNAVIRGVSFDPAWFWLMGGVAGGVLGYGAVRRK